MKSMGDIIDELLSQVRDNLAVLEKRQLHPGGDNARNRLFGTLDPVSGGKCDACGRTDTKLKACSRCKRAWYCSTDCQKSDWTVHKQNCGVKIGDHVILKNLKSKPELNGTVVKVQRDVGERWEVGCIGGDESSPMMSVSKKNVERVRRQ